MIKFASDLKKYSSSSLLYVVVLIFFIYTKKEFYKKYILIEMIDIESKLLSKKNKGISIIFAVW